MVLMCSAKAHYWLGIGSTISEAMPNLLVQITDEQAAWLSARCDRFSPKARLIRDLIESAMRSEQAPLDSPCTLGFASGSEANTSKAVSSTEETNTKQPLNPRRAREKTPDPYKVRTVSPDLIPSDLLDCQQLLPEWWAVKKGVRSEGVWNRVCGKLRGWTPEDRRRALEAAIASGWGDVFEPKGPTSAQRHGEQKPIADLAAEMEAMPSLW